MALVQLRGLLIFVLTVMAAMAVPSLGCEGVEYTVGDSSWTIRTNPYFYTNWSTTYLFKIGDSITFDFDPTHYNAIQVTKQEFESCTACNPIRVYDKSPAVFPLKDRGIFYFISNISNYCDLGLKASVTVNKCSSKPKPPPPSPPPSVAAPPPVPIAPAQVPKVSPPASPSPEYKKNSAGRTGVNAGFLGVLFGFGLQLLCWFFSILGR